MIALFSQTVITALRITTIITKQNVNGKKVPVLLLIKAILNFFGKPSKSALITLPIAQKKNIVVVGLSQEIK